MIRLEIKNFEDRFKILVIIALLSISILLMWYCHYILKISIIFTHFFYIPIILASYWWEKKGIVIPIVLAIILILFPSSSRDLGIRIIEDIIRAIMFLVISTVAIILRERNLKVTNELKDIHSELDQIFNTTGPLMVIDKIYNVIKINNRFSSFFNIKKDEIIGKKCYEILQCHSDACLLKKKIYKNSFELDKELNENTNRSCLVTSYCYRSSTGDILGVIENFTDITERKQAEQKLKELNKLKTELLIRSSHELKTPLIAIKGFSNLLLELCSERLDLDIISITEEITKGCERLEDLINAILEASKLESHQIQLKVSNEDLIFLIKFCIKELQFLLKERNHTIYLDLHEKLITKFEKEKMYIVISNLLTNAIKNTHPGGIIKVKSEIKDVFIIISIEDNGIGISTDEKNHLFKQFGKIERYGQGFDIVPEGTGLGLYISKKIVELHGGEIWFDSEGRNEGSNFSFSLPYNSDKF